MLPSADGDEFLALGVFSERLYIEDSIDFTYAT